MRREENSSCKKYSQSMNKLAMDDLLVVLLTSEVLVFCLQGCGCWWVSHHSRDTSNDVFASRNGSSAKSYQGRRVAWFGLALA